jgi:hypothetical protein
MSAVVILLDDVTPHYVKAGAALKACDVDLGIALYSLIDSEAAPHGSRYPDAAAAAVTPLRRQRPVPCRLLAPCLAAMHSKAYQALIGSLSMGAPPERFLPCLRPSGTGYPFPRR